MDLWNLINSILTFILAICLLWARSWANKKMAKIQSSLKKEEFIHKLQFEKEFQLYQSLWQKLNKFREAAVQLTNEFSSQKEQEKEERLSKASDAFVEASDEIENNRPFYSREVYDKTQEMILLGIKQFGRFHFPDPNIDILKRFQETEKIANSFLNTLGEIENVIRTRIYKLGTNTLLE